MHWLIPLGLILAGLIALAAIITSKLPQAKDVIGKLAAVQGIIGVVLLALGLVCALKIMDDIGDINKLKLLNMLTIYAGVVCAIFLGFLLGMPLIAKWIPGDSPAEQKALEMQQKILPYQTLLGVISLVSALLWIRYHLTDEGSAVLKFLF